MYVLISNKLTTNSDLKVQTVIHNYYFHTPAVHHSQSLWSSLLLLLDKVSLLTWQTDNSPLLLRWNNTFNYDDKTIPPAQ